MPQLVPLSDSAPAEAAATEASEAEPTAPINNDCKDAGGDNGNDVDVDNGDGVTTKAEKEDTSKETLEKQKKEEEEENSAETTTAPISASDEEGGPKQQEGSDGVVGDTLAITAENGNDKPEDEKENGKEEGETKKEDQQGEKDVKEGGETKKEEQPSKKDGDIDKDNDEAAGTKDQKIYIDDKDDENNGEEATKKKDATPENNSESEPKKLEAQEKDGAKIEQEVSAASNENDTANTDPAAITASNTINDKNDKSTTAAAALNLEKKEKGPSSTSTASASTAPTTAVPSSPSATVSDAKPDKTKKDSDTTTNENTSSSSPQIPPSKFCNAPGCTKVKKSNCGTYCLEHYRQNETDPVKLLKVESVYLCKTRVCTKIKRARCMGFCLNCFRKKHPELLDEDGNVLPSDLIAKRLEKEKEHKKKGGGDNNDEEEDREEGEVTGTQGKKQPKRSHEIMCKLEGCTNHHQPKCQGYCTFHSKLAHQLSAGLASATEAESPATKGGKGGKKKKKKAPSLKPLLKTKQAVYSAYWDEREDPDRIQEPAWYPGTISKYTISKTAADDDARHGFIRYYNIHFDDGDKLTMVPDMFVMAAEEYLLNVKYDEANTGKKHFRWKGVKNVFDKQSRDGWAKHVGWYTAMIDGEKKEFGLLSEALRAYDASVVRRKGIKTKRNELNLAEDWELLWKKIPEEKKKGDGGKNKGKSKEAGKKRSLPANVDEKEAEEEEVPTRKKERRKDHRWCKWEGCSKHKSNVGDYPDFCINHAKESSSKELSPKQPSPRKKEKAAHHCKWDGCNKWKRPNGEYCIKHSRTGKNCKWEGCRNPETPGFGGYCQLHQNAKGGGGQRKTPPELLASQKAASSSAVAGGSNKAKGAIKILHYAAPEVGKDWVRLVMLQPNGGSSKIEYVSPFGTRFENVGEAKKYAKLQQDYDMDDDNPMPPMMMTGGGGGAGGSSAAAVSAAAALGSNPAGKKKVVALSSTQAAVLGKGWTIPELETLITIDEKTTGLAPREKYKMMATKLPKYTDRKCGDKVLKVRKMCREGKTLADIIGYDDIKTTLARWTRSQIDELMRLEERYKEETEDVKNGIIAQMIPRWDTDKCSFKTLYMRWETRVRREAEAAEAKKRKRAEDEAEAARRAKAAAVWKEVAEKEKKAKEEALAKAGKAALAAEKKALAATAATQGGTVVDLMGANGGATKAETTAGATGKVSAAVKEAASLSQKPASTIPAKQKPTSVAQKKVSAAVTAATAAAADSKIDDNFVNMLNNDPYLKSKCTPQTIEALNSGKLKSFAKGGEEEVSPKKGEIEELLSDPSGPTKNEGGAEDEEQTGEEC